MGLDNYVHLFKDGDFQHASWVTAIFVTGCLVAGTVLVFGLVFAFALNRVVSHLRFLCAVTIVPYIVSNVAAAVMFRIRFNPEFGLLNRTIQFFGFDGLPWLSDPKLAVGRGHLLSGVDRPAADDPAAARWAADHRHPHLDAARVDGATGLNRARYVSIPLIAPQIAISVIWQSYSVLTGLGVVLALTGGGPLKATQTLPM